MRARPGACLRELRRRYRLFLPSCSLPLSFTLSSSLLLHEGWVDRSRRCALSLSIARVRASFRFPSGSSLSVSRIGLYERFPLGRDLLVSRFIEWRATSSLSLARLCVKSTLDPAAFAWSRSRSRCDLLVSIYVRLAIARAHTHMKRLLETGAC